MAPKKKAAPQAKPNTSVAAIRSAEAAMISDTPNSLSSWNVSEVEEFVKRYSAINTAPVVSTNKLTDATFSKQVEAVRQRLKKDLKDISLLQQNETVVKLLEEFLVAPPPTPGKDIVEVPIPMPLQAVIRFLVDLRVTLARMVWYMQYRRFKESRFLTALIAEENLTFVLQPPSLRVLGDEDDSDMAVQYVQAVDLYRGQAAVLGSGWETEVPYSDDALEFPEEHTRAVANRLAPLAAGYRIHCGSGRVEPDPQNVPFAAILRQWRFEAVVRDAV